MKQAHFRFYAELNDFLSADKRFTTFVHTFNFSASVKDRIESIGVPHTEVDLILANSESVGFDYAVQDGDRISVYPVFESFDIGQETHVRPDPLRDTRFVIDTHLGQLARYLRLLGFDALYRNDYSDEELARISSEEHRVLLTRDVGILKRSEVTHGYYVRATDPKARLLEVLRRFDLFGDIVPFRRCLRCNGILEPVEKGEVIDELEPLTKKYYDDFRRCDSCGQVYWRGSHFENLLDFVDEVQNTH